VGASAATLGLGQAHLAVGAPQLGEVVVWSAALLGVVVIGGLVIFALRKRLRDAGVEAGDALSLDDLRRMAARGVISQEEFEAARAAIVARHGGAGAPSTTSPLDPTRRRARPGVDLTGDPLPRPPGAEGRESTAGEGPKN